MSFTQRLALIVPVLASLTPGCDSSSTFELPPDPCVEVACSEAEALLTHASCCPYPYGRLTTDFSACSPATLQSDLYAAASPAIWLHRSMRTLELGVELGFELAYDANGALVQLAQMPEADALAAPFTFDAATGEYTASLAATDHGSVKARFSFSQDYEAGKTGDPILPYLFHTTSYVEGAKISLADGVATVKYDAEGPLVELLGFGSHPANPFQIGLFDETDLPKQTLDFDITDAEVGPGGFSGSLTAHVQRPIGLGPFQTFEPDVPITIVNASYTASPGLTIDGLDVLLSARDEGSRPSLRGAVHFRIKGGAPLVGSIVYDNQGRSELQLLCAPSD